jgi:hypothetical protein
MGGGWGRGVGKRRVKKKDAIHDSIFSEKL